MAALKFLVSAGLLATVGHCQDIYSTYSPSYSPGSQYASQHAQQAHAQYSPSIVSRGTPRLVPIKVRASASRFFPSFYYPAMPPPPPPRHFRPFYQHPVPNPEQSQRQHYARYGQFPNNAPQQAQTQKPQFQTPQPQQTQQNQQQQQNSDKQQQQTKTTGTSTPISTTSFSSSGSNSQNPIGLHAQPATHALYPRPHHYFRHPGYYRPNRHFYYASPYHQNSQQQQHHQLAYHAAATVAPIVLKRGRVLPAYALNGGSTSSTSGFGLQHYNQPHSIPAVSKYRPPPSPQYTVAQVAPQPVVRHRLQPHYQQHHIQHQPQPVYHQQQPQTAPAPQYYTPVAVATSRPGKYLKAKKPLPPSDPVENEEEEYPSDPNPQYNFSFDIKDDELTNYQNRQEERDGETIKGSYSVVDPDGYVRTVTYTADSKNGFQAKVTREPTDVKIKFPVPTEAPAASDRVVLKSSHQQGRRQAYHQQLQYQPQYQSASYSHKREVFVNAPAVTVNSGRVADDNSDDETVDEAEVAASGSEPVAVVAVVAPSASSAEVANPPEPKEEDITEHTRSRARIIRRVN